MSPRTAPTPEYQARLEEARRPRDRFAADFGVRPCHWSGYNFARFLNRTGERPERVAELRGLIGCAARRDGYGVPFTGGGLWDHGELWARDGVPCLIVGHPYGLSDGERAALRKIALGFPTLRVAVDDRPSYYGFGTHHVRVELVEPRRPFRRGVSTYRTRAAARAPWRGPEARPGAAA